MLSCTNPLFPYLTQIGGTISSAWRKLIKKFKQVADDFIQDALQKSYFDSF